MCESLQASNYLSHIQWIYADTWQRYISVVGESETDISKISLHKNAFTFDHLGFAAQAGSIKVRRCPWIRSVLVVQPFYTVTQKRVSKIWAFTLILRWWRVRYLNDNRTCPSMTTALIRLCKPTNTVKPRYASHLSISQSPTVTSSAPGRHAQLLYVWNEGKVMEIVLDWVQHFLLR